MPIPLLKLILASFAFAIFMADTSHAEQKVKLQGDRIAQFSASNIRSLASADPKDVLAYLAGKIQGDAKKSGVKLSDKESSDIAKSFDDYIHSGFTGNSTKVKVTVGTLYCRTYTTKGPDGKSSFVGVFLVKNKKP